jgi:hypothetical protein
MRLSVRPSAAVLAQCRTWLDDADPLVRGQVARLVSAHGTVPALRTQAIKALVDYVERHLAWRRKQEAREFDRVCREHGTELPPDGRIAAGADWRDPWDEYLRKIADEALAERAHMREVVGALEGFEGDPARSALLAIFAEHHDPEVVVRVIAALGARREWAALQPIADLARIQRYGRAVGGGAVIGAKQWRDLRLKWDLHKDRLWWSRPEYMPRILKPAFEAACAITGEPVIEIGSVRALDKWLLDNTDRMKKEGAPLTRDFANRAAETQR